jgi:8-oxo-dGTP pyrophosphatase MutT (NUDIX family)
MRASGQAGLGGQLRQAGVSRHERSRHTVLGADLGSPFLLQGDSILLLRRCNTGYEDGNYSVIAGHLDGGETVVTAMCREAREEAGIELDEDDTQVVGVTHRLGPKDEYFDFYLVADTWHGEVRNMEPHKCDEPRWVSLDSLPENTVPYVAVAIRAWQGGEWFTSLGWE